MYYVPIIFLFAVCTLPLIHTAAHALSLPFNRTEENQRSERFYIHSLF